ncbi:Transposase [Mannheimia sp. USDA-ARS-USMARC-1261]|uniref:IS110 family transposase n=1 Tax=Mannheimia sp. USDA-ARS-USMARC-1261 TaxID=1432056 RepID=UPI0003E3AE4D|nr:transposase [Mannheimia sp. USDA-ARS-USMARC-1261]AHG74039.1 Transposase [Mannheimia sp. USDA-ARS-USMARC-1261]
MNAHHFISIDIAKHKFDVAYLKDKARQTVKIKVLENNPKGFSQLLDWIKKNISDDYITLEPTGVYYEALVYFLHDK